MKVSYPFSSLRTLLLIKGIMQDFGCVCEGGGEIIASGPFETHIVIARGSLSFLSHLAMFMKQCRCFSLMLFLRKIIRNQTFYLLNAITH